MLVASLLYLKTCCDCCVCAPREYDSQHGIRCQSLSYHDAQTITVPSPLRCRSYPSIMLRHLAWFENGCLALQAVFQGGGIHAWHFTFYWKGMIILLICTFVAIFSSVLVGNPSAWRLSRHPWTCTHKLDCTYVYLHIRICTCTIISLSSSATYKAAVCTKLRSSELFCLK